MLLRKPAPPMTKKTQQQSEKIAADADADADADDNGASSLRPKSPILLYRPSAASPSDHKDENDLILPSKAAGSELLLRHLQQQQQQQTD